MRRPKEEFAGRLIQALVMTGLAAALLILVSTTLNLVRSSAAAKYGNQAWLLPITIGAIFLFILYRLQRIWAEVIARGIELREISKSHKNEEDS